MILKIGKRIKECRSMCNEENDLSRKALKMLMSGFHAFRLKECIGAKRADRIFNTASAWIVISA